MTAATFTRGYLAGLDAETFALDGYLAEFDARLLADPEGRRSGMRSGCYPCRDV